MKPPKIKGKVYGTYHINHGCPWFIQINRDQVIVMQATNCALYKMTCTNNLWVQYDEITFLHYTMLKMAFTNMQFNILTTL